MLRLISTEPSFWANGETSHKVRIRETIIIKSFSVRRNKLKVGVPSLFSSLKVGNFVVIVRNISFFSFNIGLTPLYSN